MTLRQDLERTRKKLLKTTIAISVLCLVVMLTSCTETHKHVSSAKFKSEYKLSNRQTMHQSEYLGEKNGRFYLRRKSMSLLNKNRWNEEIWYAIAEDLELAFLNKLRKEAKAGEEFKFYRQ